MRWIVWYYIILYIKKTIGSYLQRSNYKNYLESNSRYGKGSIDGNPIRDCKPGVVVLYDDFM